MKQKIALILSIGLVLLFLFTFVIGCSNSSSDNGDDSEIIPSSTPTHESPLNKKVVGYFVSWGIYDRNYLVTDIPANKLTHINYAFFDINTSTYQLKLFDEWADVQKVFTGDEDKGFPDQTWDQSSRGEAGCLGRLKQLKTLHPHMKTLMSIGGYSLSYKFPAVAQTENTRQTFVASCIEMMLQYEFDGIDIDWEYPDASQTENFVLLMAEFRKQLDQQGQIDGKKYLFSLAAPAGYSNIVNLGLDRTAVYFDYINIMAYDYHGGWNSVTNHNAPLNMNPNDPDSHELNIASTVDSYIGKGVPSEKLILGFPLYGRAWEEVPDTNNGLFQNSGSLPETGQAGNWEKGMFDYWKIQELIDKGKYTRYWDENSKVPWLYGENYTPGKTNGGMFVSYDDIESLSEKIKYLKEKDLGGIMYWELSGDVRDINSPNSLVRAAFEYLTQE